MGQFFTYLGAIDLGLIWGFLALGVFVTYRLLDIADLTVDGSFATGGAVCAVCILKGMHPLLAIVCGFISGMMAGAITGLLHTKCKIPAILAGILTQLGLFSINLRIMGSRANLPIVGKYNTLFFTLAQKTGIDRYYVTFAICMVITIMVILLMYYFFGTELGSAIRATGNNEQMAKSLGINTNTMKLIGLMIANGLVGLSGALNCLYVQSNDVRVGQGAIVIALASIVMGEVFIKNKKDQMMVSLIAVIVGSILYRIAVALVLQMGLNTDDLKLLTAILVGIALSLPVMMAKQKQISTYKKLTGKETD